MAALIVEAIVGAVGLGLAVYGILTGTVGTEIVGLVLGAVAWGMLLEELLKGGRH